MDNFYIFDPVDSILYGSNDQRFIRAPKVAPRFSLDVFRYLSRRNLVFVENFDWGYLFLRVANAIDLVHHVINMHIRLFKRA